ncbi:Hypothetical_protein [Hexamita inflata]|uniref:Hypothetical_protein n=1 Tax=Hexamita inflata TaxID=28002 RepID=A0AA86PLS4_9EUKA|nr:Hypothetical protein HINF_LOCUS28543 [Hexamita inflata]
MCQYASQAVKAAGPRWVPEHFLTVSAITWYQSTPREGEVQKSYQKSKARPPKETLLRVYGRKSALLNFRVPSSKQKVNKAAKSKAQRQKQGKRTSKYLIPTRNLDTRQRKHEFQLHIPGRDSQKSPKS